VDGSRSPPGPGQVAETTKQDPDVVFPATSGLSGYGGRPKHQNRILFWCSDDLQFLWCRRRVPPRRAARRSLYHRYSQPTSTIVVERKTEEAQPWGYTIYYMYVCCGGAVHDPQHHRQTVPPHARPSVLAIHRDGRELEERLINSSSKSSWRV
jgi:hypothetical protein